MPTLTLEQRQYWERLEQLLQEEGQLYLAIKRLALEMARYSAPVQVEEMVYVNGVKKKAILTKEGILFVNGKPLIYFPNTEFATKEAYISHHEKRNEWADDPLLHVVLSKLGYNFKMHLYGHPEVGPYQPYPIRQTGLTMEIYNFGAKDGGYHWERRDPVTGQPQPNPGGGNCGWHTLAQQVACDRRVVQEKYLPRAVEIKTEPRSILTPAPTSTQKPVVVSPAVTTASIITPALEVIQAPKPSERSSTARVIQSADIPLVAPAPTAPSIAKTQPITPAQTWEQIVAAVQTDPSFASKAPSTNETIVYEVDLGNKTTKTVSVTTEQQINWDAAYARNLANKGSKQEEHDHALALQLQTEEEQRFKPR